MSVDRPAVVIGMGELASVFATGLMNELAVALARDPEHACAGRTALARLRRALDQARQHSLVLPRMSAIDRELARA